MNDINFTEKEREQIDRYLEMLISKNKVLNLTRITDYDEMWVKHILDSASVLPILNEIGTKKIVDVGTGFRVIIVIEASSYVNIRSSRLLPKFKTQKINSWCAA